MRRQQQLQSNCCDRIYSITRQEVPFCLPAADYTLIKLNSAE